VTCEDHGIGGLYSAVAEVLAEMYPVPAKGVYVRGFTESGTCMELYGKYGLNTGSIAEAARSVR